jgi:hypothetical protein
LPKSHVNPDQPPHPHRLALQSQHRESVGKDACGGVTHVSCAACCDILPRPETLQAYQTSVPDIAERLVALAEQEQAHRHCHEDDMHAIIGREAEQEHQLRSRSDALALIMLFACVAFHPSCGSLVPMPSPSLA